MADLFFRDGCRYKGHFACDYNKAAGAAKVLDYPVCGSCKGEGRGIRWYNGTGWPCQRCKGLGLERYQRWTKLYTKEKLQELNDKKHPPKSPSVVAVAEFKRGFKQFVKERGNLIADIQEHAPMSERLQYFAAQITDGMALEPSEIREALRCIDKLKK